MPQNLHDRGRMDRVSFRIPEALLDRVDRQVELGVYPSRSEALRQYIRKGIESDEGAETGRTQPFQPGD